MRSSLNSLVDYEIIELLFSLASPYSKYKKQAIECTKRFGNLRGLMEASHEELRQCGVTPRAILCVRLMFEIPTRVLKQRITDKLVYNSSQAVFNYLYYSMRSLKNEVFKVIHLNSRNQIIETIDLFEGTLDNISVFPRGIVESAIRYRAVSMIFAHNHPSGDPTPSKSDKQLTRDLVFIGNILQIKVLDHIIIGDSCHFSFAGEGLIEKYEDSFLNLGIKAGT
jgi:DNA repair protein RadC